MAAGGFLLTQHCPQIEEWFKVGEECDIYHSIDECIDKVKYYLDNESERLRIANNGYIAVHKNHTYKHRIKQVLDDTRRQTKGILEE